MRVMRCRTCRKLGVGPGAVRLYPFESWMYCAEDFKKALQWHEQRAEVLGGIEHLRHLHRRIIFNLRYGKLQELVTGQPPTWEPYIRDLCGLAEFGFVHGDRKTFVRYAALAVLAWGLREVEHG